MSFKHALYIVQARSTWGNTWMRWVVRVPNLMYFIRDEYVTYCTK